MSIIMDALEKAQRDKDRKKGEVTEESLLHPTKVAHSSSSAGRYFLIILISNIAVMLIIGGIFFIRKSNVQGTPERQEAGQDTKMEAPTVTQVAEQASAAPMARREVSASEETVTPEKKRGKADSTPIYHKELMLDNGLRLKVDGVYLDGGIPYALIGPDIVKSGDVIEGGVNVLHIDFKKVEIDYKGKRLFLLAQ